MALTPLPRSQELTVEATRIRPKRTFTEQLKLISLRVLTNATYFGILAGFAYCLVYLDQHYGNATDGSQFSVPVVAGGGTSMLPMAFAVLSASEKWDSPTIRMRFIIMRSYILRVLTICTLLVYDFTLAGAQNVQVGGWGDGWCVNVRFPFP